MSLGPTEVNLLEQTMMEYRSWVEEEKLKELKKEKENEEAEESLVTTSPVDLELGELKEEKENEEAEESLTISSTTTMTSHQLTSPPTGQFCSQRAEQL